jgi:hypothetical protein
MMCNALKVCTLPWAWPLFALMLSSYLSGFESLQNQYPFTLLNSLNYYESITPFSALCQCGFFVNLILTYAMLFTEPNRLMLWKKLVERGKVGDWRGWFENLPLWPTTYVLTLVFAVLPIPGSLNSSSYYISMISLDSLQFTVMSALLPLRDALIVLSCSFAPRARCATITAILYIMALNLLQSMSLILSTEMDFLGVLFVLSFILFVQVMLAFGLVSYRLDSNLSA